jgi:hypothetical protein
VSNEEPPREISEGLAAHFGRERWNEHVKLAAGAFNGLAIACFVGAFVAPLVNPAPPQALAIASLLTFGAALHLAAHAILRYFREKE